MSAIFLLLHAVRALAPMNTAPAPAESKEVAVFTFDISQYERPSPSNSSAFSNIESILLRGRSEKSPVSEGREGGEGSRKRRQQRVKRVRRHAMNTVGTEHSRVRGGVLVCVCVCV